MRLLDQRTQDAWRGNLNAEAYKPTVRATVQRAHVRTFNYDLSDLAGEDRFGTGTFSTIIFAQDSPPIEIRNIKSFTWERGVDVDVATATMTLLNTEVVGIGEVEDDADDPASFERMGWMTYNRGEQAVSANRWGYDTDTGWQDLIVPDRLVKTYEGYGRTSDVEPHDDTYLHQSGTWLIDTVKYSSDGTIVVQMRDVGRLLMDQICFPPVIPRQEYPLRWERIGEGEVYQEVATGGSLITPTYNDTSNTPYIGLGISDDGEPYVGPAGQVRGHYPRHATDDDATTYWLSTGYRQTGATVWWEGTIPQSDVISVKIKPRGGPYKVYISVMVDGDWQGTRKIPYRIGFEDVDVAADIKFVKQQRVMPNEHTEIVLPRIHQDVTRIRVTFSDLWDSGIGTYVHRAGLTQVQVRAGGDVSSSGENVTAKVGNYRDYTEIVQWLCAWGGFYWPPASTGMDFFRFLGNEVNGVRELDYRFVSYELPDGDVDAFPRGSVWGDFMDSGTYGVAQLTEEIWDKQPLLDGITYIRDLLGFVFWIDETGAVIWRMPNLWKLGNYLAPGDLNVRSRARTEQVLVLDEDDVLLMYDTTLDSRNIRERVFVSNTAGAGKGKNKENDGDGGGDDNGPDGVVIKGWNPYFTKFRRTAGWTDEHFKGTKEAKIMADMIVARQMFTYRNSSVTIKGYPGIQVDDQVRIFERTTNETFYHYVLGISSSLDNETGEWTYQLTTHWLGERPSDAWVVDVELMDNATQNYLNLLGVTG